MSINRTPGAPALPPSSNPSQGAVKPLFPPLPSRLKLSPTATYAKPTQQPIGHPVFDVYRKKLNQSQSQPQSPATRPIAYKPFMPAHKPASAPFPLSKPQQVRQFTPIVPMVSTDLIPAPVIARRHVSDDLAEGAEKEVLDASVDAAAKAAAEDASSTMADTAAKEAVEASVEDVVKTAVEEAAAASFVEGAAKGAVVGAVTTMATEPASKYATQKMAQKPGEPAPKLRKAFEGSVKAWGITVPNKMIGGAIFMGTHAFVHYNASQTSMNPILVDHAAVVTGVAVENLWSAPAQTGLQYYRLHPDPKSTSPYKLLMESVEKDGVRSLYRGYPAQVLSSSMFTCSFFDLQKITQEKLTQDFKKFYGRDPSDSDEIAIAWASGSLGAALAAGPSYPFRKLAVDQRNSQSLSLVETGKQLVRRGMQEGGLQGVVKEAYRGFGATLVTAPLYGGAFIAAGAAVEKGIAHYRGQKNKPTTARASLSKSSDRMWEIGV